MAPGIFGDPNDVCEILNCAMIFSLYGLLDRGGGLRRVLWLAPMALFGHALALTHSRGGFLGAVVGLMVLFRSRFRGTKSLVLAGAALALMFVLSSAAARRRSAPVRAPANRASRSGMLAFEMLQAISAGRHRYRPIRPRTRATSLTMRSFKLTRSWVFSGGLSSSGNTSGA